MYLFHYRIIFKFNSPIYSTTKDKGWIRYMQGDEENLYLFLYEENITKCYVYQTEEKKIQPYFKDSKIEGPMVSAGFMNWWGNPRTIDRNKTQYYLLDVKNNTNYIYDDSVIYSSKKGIVWVKFNVDEKEIPPLEIFKNNNATIMYCSMEQLKR